MGSKSDAPPAPDYSGVANASEKSAEMSFQLGQDQLAWAKEQYGKDSAITKQVVDDALATSATNNANAAKDRERYETIYQPLEDQLANDAESYATDDRRQHEMGKAGATVAQNFDAQRSAALQSLEGFGVDPTSTRFAALDTGVRASKAAAMAAAQNSASDMVDATGRALRSEAINVGRGYPGQVVNSYNTALSAGNQAANSQLAQTASGANTMGTGTQWQGLGNQGLSAWSGALNGQSQADSAAFKNSQGSSSGVGTALGIIGPMAMMAMGMETGGAVPDGSAIPDGSATPGGAIPAGASPTGGAIPDDVNARLTPGEFVVPKDVMSWKGEEFFQNLIKKSRESKPQGPAQPQVRPAQPGPVTFASRPSGGGALPV